MIWAHLGFQIIHIYSYISGNLFVKIHKVKNLHFINGWIEQNFVRRIKFCSFWWRVNRKSVRVFKFETV